VHLHSVYQFLGPSRDRHHPLPGGFGGIPNKVKSCMRSDWRAGGAKAKGGGGTAEPWFAGSKPSSRRA